MKLQEKQTRVEALASKLSGSNAIYLTDFTGLNVKSITDLRARLRHAGVEYLVVKNTLAERALEGLDLPDIAEFLVGPTALALSEEDPVAPAKVLWDFAKEHDHRPSVKVGLVERRTVTASQVERLAALPSRDQLLAQLAGTLQAPLSQLLHAMQAKLQEMVGLLEALRAARGA